MKFGNSDGSLSQPLIVKDGVVVEGMIGNNIPPESIESIDVLKGESATKMFGDKGKNGVVLITSKKGALSPSTGTNEVSVIGYGTYQKENHSQLPNSGFKIRSFGTNPLVVVDGVISENKQLSDINPESIQLVVILKSETAIQKYGDKGKNGVVEITLKEGTVNIQNKPSEIEVVGYAKDQKVNKASSEIQIRSNGTSETESKPLIVIDGKISENKDLNKLDSKTVESVSVLKNELAISKYGDQAKNGVIEIVMKKANKSDESKGVISVPKKLIIVPNPANNQATITAEDMNQSTKLDVSIYDRYGKQVKAEQKTGPTFSLNTSDLTTGTYLISANDVKNQYTGNLVVVH